VAKEELTLNKTEPRPPQLCNIGRLLTAMAGRGMDGLLSYYSRNVLYLSGYGAGTTGIYGEANGVAAFVLSRHEPDHPIVIVPDFEVNFFRYQPTWVRDIRPYRSLILPLDLPWNPDMLDRFAPAETRSQPWFLAAKANYSGSFIDACVKALRDLGLDKATVGFDNLSFAPFVADRLTDMKVVDAYSLMKYVRMVKTDAELRLLREAHLLNQTAIEKVVSSYVPGMTWHDLNTAYFLEVTRLGGFVVDRGSLVLFNPRGSEAVVQFASGLEPDFSLEPGMHVMFDCHGRWKGYNWDGGKTWVVGGETGVPSRRIARVCGDALEEVLNAARPGVRLSQLQALGRRVFERHGVPAPESALIYFHGVGLDNSEHEWGTPADWVMEAGTVVAVHIYYPGDERHRYYIEEVGVVTPSGIDRFFTWDMGQPLTP